MESILLPEGAAREIMDTWTPLPVMQSLPVKNEMLSFFLTAILLGNAAGSASHQEHEVIFLHADE